MHPFTFSTLALLGFLSTWSCSHCQTETFNPGGPVSNIASIEREIAKFESNQRQGRGDPHHTGGHAHGTQPEVHHGSPRTTSDRHTHQVGTVHRPGRGEMPHITDIHGNQPPHPGGLHVDLPGEHGNKQTVPILHHGQDPIPHDTMLEHAVSPPGSGSILGPPTLKDLSLSKGASIPNSIHPIDPPVSDPVLPDSRFTDPGLSFPDDVFSGPGVNIPDGVSSPALQPPSLEKVLHSGVRVDGPGEHGNDLSVPVVHRPTQPGGPTLIRHGESHLPPVEPAHIGTHVDRPGEHGNVLPHPVIHRPEGPSPTHGGTHVDGPGEHGNNLHVPVIHRDISPPISAVEPIHHSTDPFLRDTHVDAPGVHGNNLDIPVIHRPLSPGGPINMGPAGGSIASPNPFHNTLHQGTHVDAPGEHGNTLPVAVLHRPQGPISPSGPVPQGIPHQGTHVDAPGEHGNTLPVAVLHRPHGPNPPVGPAPHFPVHGTHVDAPGKHGNTLPVSVLHRPGVPTPPAGIHHGAPHLGTHVDAPGEHGNNMPVAVLHRPQEHSPPLGPALGHQGTHVDAPGEHGNTMPVAVLHRPQGHIPPVGPALGHQGTHVDAPGEHGNTMPVAVLHRPDGTGLDGPAHTGPVGHGMAPGHMPGFPDSQFDPHVPVPGLHPPVIDHFLPPPGGPSPGMPGIEFTPHTLLTPDGAPIPLPATPTILPGGIDPIIGEPTARLRIPVGVPIGSPNVPVVPDHRRNRRIMRRMRRIRNRELARANRELARDSLLGDVLRTSEVVAGKDPHIGGHHHDLPHKPTSRGVVIVRRQPAATGLIGALLGSLVSGGGPGPRPVMVRLGGPPPPPQDPLQAIGRSLVGMVMNRLASG